MLKSTATAAASASVEAAGKAGAGPADLYGFPLTGLTQAESLARADCAARLARRRSNWVSPGPGHSTSTGDSLAALASAHGANPGRPASTKLKLAVRDGIPPSVRPQIWLALSGADRLRASAPADAYAQAVRSAVVNALSLTHLEADLSAVFPSHPALTSRRLLEPLRRVVMAYASRNPTTGYSPNLAGIACFAMLVVGHEHEEDVFWLLAAMVEHVLPPAYYEDCKGCTVELRVFATLLAKKCPRLCATLDKLEVDVAALTEPWFVCLFTKTLPAETTARVWDALLCEGPKVLVRVALALLKANQAALLNSCHGLQLPRMLQWRVSRTYNTDALIKVAFKGIGSLPTVAIQRSRAVLQGGITAEIDAQKARIQALVAASPAATLERPPKRRAGSAPSLNVIEEEDSSSGSSSSSDRYYLSE